MYVSRAYQIEIFVRRPSVCGITQNTVKLWLLVARGHTLGSIFNVAKTRIPIIHDVCFNMGPNGSVNFKTLLLLQIATEYFKLLLNFLLNGPHKTMFGTCEILSFHF